MTKKTAIMLSTAVITTLLSFNPPVQAASDPEIRATEYNMDVRLNPHKNQLTEKVTMHVVNNGKQTVKNLLVRNMAHSVLSYDHHFKATKNAKTTIKSISTDGKKLSYTTGKDKSNLFVNKTLAAGESTNLTVNVITDVP